MNRSRKRFSPLGDFLPLKMYQSSLNKCQQNLKAKQNPIKNVEGELFRLNAIISDQKSEIFALKCQVNEKNLTPNPSHTSYASALKFPLPQKFTPNQGLYSKSPHQTPRTACQCPYAKEMR